MTKTPYIFHVTPAGLAGLPLSIRLTAHMGSERVTLPDALPPAPSGFPPPSAPAAPAPPAGGVA